MERDGRKGKAAGMDHLRPRRSQVMKFDWKLTTVVYAHTSLPVSEVARTSIRSRVFVRRVAPPLDRGSSRGAHAHAVKQRRTAARSARTRYYESRGPSSDENNGQPFRDNDELALHLACVYVYHAANPTHTSTATLPVIVSSSLTPYLLSFSFAARYATISGSLRTRTPHLFYFQRPAQMIAPTTLRMFLTFLWRVRLR